MSRRGAVHRGVIVVVVAVLAVVVVAGLFVSTRRVLPPEYVQSFDSPAERLTRIVLSPDGESLAAASTTGEVFVWRLPGGRRTQPGAATGAATVSLGFAPDGLLLSGDATGRLRVWPSPDFAQEDIASPKLPVTCFAFRQADGKQEILLGLSDGRLVTVGAESESARNSGHPGLKAIVVADDGQTLITAGTDGRLIWHDADRGRIQHAAVAHATEVSLLDWSPDRTRLASADWNGTIKIWNPVDHSLLLTLQQPDAVSALVWQGDRVVTGSWDGQIRLWSLDGSSGNLIHSIATGRPVYGLSLTQDDRLVASVTGGSDVDFWRIGIESQP